MEVGLRLDPLAAAMAIAVLLVSALVLAYAAGYVGRDDAPRRFFATMALFVVSMLVLVLADTLLTLFVAWELVGLASYLLIGHRRDDLAAAAAARKAFLVTRTADLAFLAAVALAAVATGTTRLDAVFAWAGSGDSLVPLVGALVVVGAAGKSAQLPFSAWLPDAMRGPTPVSALLHSATMVAAGAFLLVRLYPLLEAAGILPVVAVVGLLTAVFGSLAALAQTDLKRLLAYSTIAQLAEAIAAVGLFSPVAAMLFLLAHAGYKASLFLSAGVLERLAASTDMREIARRGPRRREPLTHVSFALAALALAGLPISIAPAAAEGVLDAGLAAGAAPAVLLSLIAVATGAYAGRAYRLTFTAPRPSEPRAPAGPGIAGAVSLPLMRVAALALVALVVILGILTSPLLGAPLAAWLAHGLGRAAPELQIGSSLLGIALSAVGIALGLASPRIGGAIPARTRSLASRGFALDAALAGLAGMASTIARALARVDRATFDRLAPAAALLGVGVSRALARVETAAFEPLATGVARGGLALFVRSERLDRGGVDRAFDRGAAALAHLAERSRQVQSGLVERYLAAIAAWVAVLVAIAVVAIVVRP